jgi:sugar phosphate isomerase/epimerase
VRSCFSTLGCPEWKLDRIARCVEECGYRGLELRGLEGEMFLPHHPALAPQARADFRARFESLGCPIACVSSSASLTAASTDGHRKSIDEARAFIELAADLGSDLIRVFAGRIAEGDDRATSAARMVETLSEIEPDAGAAKVKVAVETHDDWCRGVDLAPVIAEAASDCVGILWDINHPYRHGEAPETTAEAIGGHLLHIHAKDGIQGGSYTLFGKGDLPLRRILSILRDRGYSGYLSFEWEKKWHPEIEEPEIALPDYARVLAEMLDELGIREGNGS